ncbi:MAG: apolipoprotein N-acyltransferase, partial [Caulobacteraceae bacterium]
MSRAPIRLSHLRFRRAAKADPVSPNRHPALNGWPGLLLALGGGMAAALAHPPFGVLPGVAGFGAILFALDGASSRHSLRSGFARGWAAGFGYLLISTWWIAEAFFVDAAEHGWQAPFAIAFVAGGIGLFWGAAGLVYRLIAPRGAWRVLVFAAVLSVFEWLRGHVLTGFPWDLPGEIWKAGSALSQGASVVGAYGMTFVNVAIGASVAVLAARDTRRAKIVTVALAALMLLGLWGFGAWRLSNAHEPDTAVRLRIVQPGLGEEAEWTQAKADARVERFLHLTTLPSAQPADLVIWPEGAIPYAFKDYLAPGSWTEVALQRALSVGQTLMVGGFREAGEGANVRYYNTLLAVQRTPAGLLPTASYDKYRLVPFGEFLPMAGLFQRLGVQSLVQNGLPTTPGPLPAPISPAGLPRVQPLICYESLFPGFTSSKGGRPAWIVNISDDAWFGRTSGPLQHLNIASYRAIEEGLPIIRDTPTGVSAIIDSYGRVRASLGLGRA